MNKIRRMAATAAMMAGSAMMPAAAEAAQQDGACAPIGALEFLCGPGNAEDLVRLPDSNWIVAGGIGTRRGIEARAGLRLIDRKTLAWRHWLPDGPMAVAHDTSAFPGCATPPDPATFMAHGLAIRRQGKGRSRLYVVNHGGRESIEVFDVDARSTTPRATWVGCLIPNVPAGANSVAVAPDGTVYATVFLTAGTTIADVLAGRPTGYILSWRRGDSTPRKLEGSDLSGANGLEISPRGERLYAVAFGTKQLVTFDRAGRRLGVAQVEGYWPDNVRWDDRGRLVVAGMTTNDVKCEELADPATADPASPCYRAFVVDAVDPATMRVSRVATAPTSTAFSHVSGALIDRNRLWLGTVGATRIAHMPLP